MNYEKLLEAVCIIESSIETCPENNAKHWIFGQCQQTIHWLKSELKRNLTSRRSRAADVCACKDGGLFDFGDSNICINCGGINPPPA